MLSKEEVLKIAKLARLRVNPDELEGLTKDFNAILEYVRQLEKIDVSEVQPMSHVHGVTNIFREDVVIPSPPTELMLRGTPNTSGAYIRVPIIIEQL